MPYTTVDINFNPEHCTELATETIVVYWKPCINEHKQLHLKNV